MSSRPEPEGMPGAAWALPDELRLLAELGDAQTVREVITVFQSDTQKRIIKLHQALVEGNAPQARGEAHAMKGSAAQVGAIQVSNICRDIEQAAVRSDLDAARLLMPELEKVFAAVRSAMERLDVG